MVTSPAPSSRIAGIDLARWLAIAGMLAVHVGRVGRDEPAGQFYLALTHGRASVLFALLAGVGTSLLARSRSATRLEARARLVWQAALLLPLGLALQGLDITIRVIIAHYAVLFLLGAACLSLRDRTIAGLALVSVVFGPLVFLIGRTVDPGTFNRAAVEIGDGPLNIVHGLLLSGSYPFITWAAPFLVGMLLGRRNLANAPLRAALVISGFALAFGAALLASTLEVVLGAPARRSDWLPLIDNTPHSQMPLWLVGSTGSALLALGFALTAADLLGRLAWPLVATGQVALTVYVAHILAFHWLGNDMRGYTVGDALVIVGLFLGAAAVFATAWRALLPRGPLESLMALPGIAARWRRAG